MPARMLTPPEPHSFSGYQTSNGLFHHNVAYSVIKGGLPLLFSHWYLP